MKTIKMAGKEIVFIRWLSPLISYKGKYRVYRHMAEIVCSYCGKPKVARWESLQIGKELVHLECRNKIFGERKREERAKDGFKTVVIDNVITKLKSRCKQRKLILSISREEIEQLVLANCFYCGQEPNQIYYGYGLKYNGIDRVNNQIGYIMSNCVTCCEICNRAKSVMSIADFYSWIARIAIYNGYTKTE